jgi:aspartate/methionine/tyrosine aminotransferase
MTTHSNYGSALLQAAISCGVPFAQAGAVAALECAETTASIGKMVHAYQHRRDVALDVLDSYGLKEYTPEGAFYLLVRIQDPAFLTEHPTQKIDDVEFCKSLLEESLVAVSPGSAFGDVSDGFVRVSLARDVELVKEGVGRLCKAIAVVRDTDATFGAG